jgi:hypothetical protein
MHFSSKRRAVFLTGAGVFLLVALYGLLGFFQAAMLFTGIRALRNSNIWASVFLVGAGLSILCLQAARKRASPLPNWRRNVLRLFFLSVCALLSAGALWRLADDYAALDSCLDRGGSFEYVRSVCDFSFNHPAVSVFSWRGVFITAALVFGFPVALAGIQRLYRLGGGPRHAL